MQLLHQSAFRLLLQGLADGLQSQGIRLLSFPAWTSAILQFLACSVGLRRQEKTP